MNTIAILMPGDMGSGVGRALRTHGADVATARLAAAAIAAAGAPFLDCGIIGRTPFAAETRETVDLSRTLEQAIAVYAEHLTPGAE